MPLIDPEDYPTTPRGYRHPPDDVGGVNVANDVPGDVTRLAEDIDADVTAHEADTTNVHGIADTSALVLGTRTVTAGAGLSGGGNLSADRTLSVATGGVTDAMLAGSITPSKVTGTALVASSVDAKGDLLAATGADTVGRLPVGADGGVLVADSGEASGIGWKSLAEADVARASQVGNLLTANQASFEDGTSVLVASGGGGPTVTNSATYAAHGSRSCRVDIASGAETWIYVPVPTLNNGPGYAAVTGGETYTATMSIRESIAQQWRVRIYWYAGSTLTSTSSGDFTTISTTSFTELSVTGAAPASATTATILLHRPSGSTSTVWVDKVGFWRGAGGSWALPGQPITGLHSAAYVAAPTAVTLNRAQPVVSATGGSVTYTLPTAADNTGVKFTIINSGTGTVTVSGITGLTIPGKGQVEVISTGSAWTVLSGRYSTNAVGLASYEWNHASNAWRLIAYDTGWRDITDNYVNGWQSALEGYGLRLRRRNGTIYLSGYLDGTSATNASVRLLGSEWRPSDGTVASGSWSKSDGTVSGPAILQNQQYLVLFGSYQNTNLLVSMSWPSRDALPSSLPGTQVTAPA